MEWEDLARLAEQEVSRRGGLESTDRHLARQALDLGRAYQAGSVGYEAVITALDALERRLGRDQQRARPVPAPAGLPRASYELLVGVSNLMLSLLPGVPAAPQLAAAWCDLQEAGATPPTVAPQPAAPASWEPTWPQRGAPSLMAL